MDEAEEGHQLWPREQNGDIEMQDVGDDMKDDNGSHARDDATEESSSENK